MKIAFTKMHSLGNDFMVIDALLPSVALTPLIIQALGDRHQGVGFDQLLLLEPASHSEVDFNYRVYNADGSESGQCGNGARALARFITERGLSSKKTIRVLIQNEILELKFLEQGDISVTLGIPRFAPQFIPTRLKQTAQRYSVQLFDQNISVGLVNVGNPHAVFVVDNQCLQHWARFLGLEEEHVEQDVTYLNSQSIAKILKFIGQSLQGSADFPQSVNVGLMRIIDKSHIELRVYERGAGETLACGSGATAAVIIGRTWNFLEETVDVHLPGGTLSVSWPGENHPVILTGPTRIVYEGMIDIDHLMAS